MQVNPQVRVGSGLKAFLSLAVAFGMVVILSLPASASHPTPAKWHLKDIHTGNDQEDFCVNTTGATSGQAAAWFTAYGNIVNALWQGAPTDDQKWDGKSWGAAEGWWRVWFIAHGSAPCQSLPVAERGPIEIEYWLEADARLECGEPQNPLPSPRWAADGSCAVKSTPVTGPYGHTDYEYYYEFLYAPYTIDSVPNVDGAPAFYRHQVNHETGHALGFKDGAGASDCPDSVMHSKAYSCSTNRRWPSPGDTIQGMDRIAFNLY